ncbi:MAG: shikimate kinase [Dehalococcoidia bacterium]|nr:MAG: shikimate kinase [Dehalococcoidia bacterium]
MSRTNVALIGFMGAGKSTVGPALAARLGKTFVETDALVEQRTGMAIADVFSRYGEQYFRELEAAVVQDVAKSRECVISCGGGVVLREDNVSALRTSAVLVHLEVSPQAVLERLSPRSIERPLLNGPDREQRVSELMERRRPLYAAAADFTLATDGLCVEDIVDGVEERLARQ